MNQVPPEIKAAFERFCTLHDWTPAEVLAYLMLYALKQGVDLAIPLHSQRSKIAHKGQEKWSEEQLKRLDLY